MKEQNGARGLKLKQQKKGVLLMLLSSLCACAGQLLWKLSAAHGLAALLLGFFLYGVGALIMLYAYRFGELSVLQPALASSYALSVILGAAVLHEAVTWLKCAGIAAIVLGVALISGGKAE